MFEQLPVTLHRTSLMKSSLWAMLSWSGNPLLLYYSFPAMANLFLSVFSRSMFVLSHISNSPCLFVLAISQLLSLDCTWRCCLYGALDTSFSSSIALLKTVKPTWLPDRATGLPLLWFRKKVPVSISLLLADSMETSQCWCPSLTVPILKRDSITSRVSPIVYIYVCRSCLSNPLLGTSFHRDGIKNKYAWNVCHQKGF